MLSKIYADSQTHKIILMLTNTIAGSLKNSFLGKITEARKDDGDAYILCESRTVRWWIRTYNSITEKLLRWIKTSKIYNLTNELKDKFYSFPLRVIGVVIVAAVSMNILLCIFVKTEINFWGWFIRGLLLFIGLCALNSPLDWAALKKHSRVIKVLQNFK